MTKSQGTLMEEYRIATEQAAADKAKLDKAAKRRAKQAKLARKNKPVLTKKKKRKKKKG